MSDNNDINENVFDPELEEPDMVTIELEDGTEFDCVVLSIYDAPNGKQYIALLPLDENGDNQDGEVFLYRCGEQDGEITMENIESDEEYEIASAAFDEWLDSQEFDELVDADLIELDGEAPEEDQ